MTERKLCEFYLVAGPDGFEVGTDRDGAIEEFVDNVNSYGTRRVFKLAITVPVDEIVTEAGATLPDDAQGGTFELTPKE